ncbi:MAG TPA: metal-dependent hydrolase [Candidatus Latescibacteria bacterium]|nr:metal-dependent hydrolase [Candidatus Latescibacterota bacterium]
MLIDVNAYLGHFAFRRLRYNTAEELLKLMDGKGIDKAIVSSASAITYRNPQSGNEELTEQVDGHRDRLIPFAVINPAYAGWKDDLRICHEEFRMKGVRLYPKWHNYDLTDPRCIELINRATKMGMLISIPIRVEDYRQRSWLVDVPDVPLDEIEEVVRRCPDAKFILLNGIGFVRSALGRKENDLPDNYLIEISRLSVLIGEEIGQLVENVGAGRLVFGTGIPFKYPDPALLKLEVLEISDEEKEMIRWRNIAALGI